MLLLWASLVCCINMVCGLPEVIKIVGLFEEGDNDLTDAFRKAVDRINTDSSILPRSRLSAQIVRLAKDDSFRASKTICRLIQDGVAVIFGPKSPSCSALVQSTCHAMEIPHIVTNWEYRFLPDAFSVNIYPHAPVLGRAYLDLILTKKWKTFTIIYENNEGLIRLQELLKAPSHKDVKITLQQLTPGLSYKKLLKDIGKRGETNIILDIPAEKVPLVFREAQDVGMMTAYHNYIVTSLDLHTIKLDGFQHGATNISGFRLVDPTRQNINMVVRDWTFGEYRYGLQPGKDHMLKTDTALIYDGLGLFARALHDLDRTQTIDVQRLSCDDSVFWNHGNSIIAYIKVVTMEGITGDIRLNESGVRTNFSLDLIELKHDGLKKAAFWNPQDGIVFTRNYTVTYIQEVKQTLKNRTLRVSTIINHPYTMIKENADMLEGNDKFEGYCIDLIHELSKVLEFKYTIQLVKDKSHGSKNERGEWNGMIRELIDREADIAIADLTMTYEREEAVDFTMPFMNLGISILFKKPTIKVPKLFQFLAPLSLDVWIYMVTSYLGVSLMLFILARLSPYEWDNPHPCDPENDVLENQFNLSNSFWFTIGSLMQQGSDIAPKAMSTRLLAGIWWFFTLIMISSYTANLAAFLTASRMTSPIESAEDLAKQTKIQYGCLKSGSTKSFFQSSTIPTYKRMWTVMESSRPTVFAESNEKGMERVLKGNYAYLMESTSIEYRTERNCELMQIGGLLDQKGYGIATPPGSPYRNALSSAVLHLQEAGVLYILKEKWWKVKGGDKCKDESNKGSGSTSEMGLANVGGVFVVLLAGLGVACIIAIMEFIWKTQKITREERDSLCTEMFREIRQIISCRGSSRPAPKTPDESSQADGITLSSLRTVTSVNTRP